MSSDVGFAPRKGPLFWVLIAGVLFLVLLFGGLLGVGWYGSRSLKATEPMDVLRQTIKINRNLEILEEDPAAIRIRARDKSTGKESIHSIDPVTKQFHVIEGDGVTPPKAPVK
jgi:hypothetical protein